MIYIERLRETLRFLISHPNRPEVRSTIMPPTLFNEIKRRLLIASIENSDTNATDALYEFGNDEEVPIWLDSKYRALIRTGIDDDECILLILNNVIYDNFDALEFQELSQKAHNYWSLLEHESFGIDESEIDILLYATNNHLCHYEEDKWMVTGLCKAFLRMPKLQSVRFLLSLETYLNTNNNDLWHMPRSYLQQVLEETTVPRAPQYLISRHIPKYLYANRINGFGLTSEGADNSDNLVLTSFGQSCIESVLAKDSVFDLLVPIYVREEMVGSAAPQYANKEDIDRFKGLLDKSPIVGDQKEPILVEVDRLIKTDEAYLSIFKALAPCIEGILRNITQTERLEVSGLGIKAYKNAITNASPQILKLGTLETIDLVFRPHRNIVEHGHVIAAEPARMLCEITLAVVEQIHKDFYEYREK
ncbi:hypothetical protein ACFLV7_04240 [Chloroflexota bacterium]